MENRLQISHLTTGYSPAGRKPLILQQEMNAQLKSGQLIGILGANGAGKSTLLRTLAGFQKPLSGEILINETPVDFRDFKKLSRLIAVVLTDRFSEPYLTVFDVIRTGRFPYLSFWGKLSPSDRIQITRVMEKLGIVQFKEKLFHELSDGEKQKVLIARALVQDTPFLLLDEPVAFIDSPGRIEIMELLLALAHEEKKAVLLTTHDMETALQYTDCLWLLHREKPLLTGIPEDLVLDGQVEHYLKRTALVFDKSKGRFVKVRQKQETGRRVVLEKTDSVEMQWLKRALERKGYACETKADMSGLCWKVDWHDGRFRLYRNEEKKGEYPRISGLLNQLEEEMEN
jgi:iron complex transport system ATP-binding protein